MPPKGLGELTTFPQIPELVGRHPPREPHPHSRPWTTPHCFFDESNSSCTAELLLLKRACVIDLISIWRCTYAVIGCSEITPPDGAFVSRHLDSAAIICNQSAETYYVTCRDGQWSGHVGNCTRAGACNSISRRRTFAVRATLYLGLTAALFLYEISLLHFLSSNSRCFLSN